MKMKLAMILAFAAAASSAAVQDPAPSRAWVTNYVTSYVDHGIGTNVQQRIRELEESFDRKVDEIGMRFDKEWIGTNKYVEVGGTRCTIRVRLADCTRDAIIGTYSTIPSITNMVFWAWSQDDEAFVNYTCREIQVLRPAMATNIVTRPITNRLYVAIDPNADTNNYAKYEANYFISYETTTNVTPYLYAPRDGDQYGWITSQGGGAWMLIANSTNAQDAALHIQLGRAKITEKTYQRITRRPMLLKAGRSFSSAGDGGDGGAGGHWDYDKCIPKDTLKTVCQEMALQGELKPLEKEGNANEIKSLPLYDPPNYGDTVKNEHGDSGYPTKEAATDPRSYFKTDDSGPVETISVTYVDPDGVEHTEKMPFDLFLRQLDPPWDEIIELIIKGWEDPEWIKDPKRPPPDKHRHYWITCRCSCGKTREHNYAASGECMVCANINSDGTPCGAAKPGIENHGGWHGCGMFEPQSDDLVSYPNGMHHNCSCGEYYHGQNMGPGERFQKIVVGHSWDKPSSWSCERVSRGASGNYCVAHSYCTEAGCNGEKIERGGHEPDDEYDFSERYVDGEYDYINHWKRWHCKRCDFGSLPEDFEYVSDIDAHKENPATLVVTPIDKEEHYIEATCKDCGGQMALASGGEPIIEGHIFGSDSPDAIDDWEYYNPRIEGEGDLATGYHDRKQICIGNGIIPEKGGCGAETNELHLACERETDPVCHCTKCKQELPHQDIENECGFHVCELCGKFLETNLVRLAEWNDPSKHQWFNDRYDSVNHYCKCRKHSGPHYPEDEEHPYRQDDDFYYYKVYCNEGCGYRYPDKKVSKDGKSGTDEENNKKCYRHYGTGTGGCKHGGGSRPGHEIGDWIECVEGYPESVVDKQTTKECNCPDLPEGGTCPVCGVNVPAPQEDEPPYRDEEVSRELKVVMLDVPPPIQTWQITIRRTWRDGKVEIIHKVENVWPL